MSVKYTRNSIFCRIWGDCSIDKEITRVLRSAMLLLKKRIAIADKNYDKIAKLLEYIATDEDLSAKERQKLYSALGELELAKLSDISALVSKLMEKLPEPVPVEKNIEIIISDHGCGA